MITNEYLESVRASKTAHGKSFLIQHLNGDYVRPHDAILAHCFDCMGFYERGREDCETPECALYPFMPYNPDKRKLGAPKKPVSEYSE